MTDRAMCILLGSCEWFEFKLWDGKDWIRARCCKRHGCGREAFFNGKHWVAKNLRHYRAPGVVR